MRRQSGKFKAVADDAKEAYYTSKESKLFANSSEEESNEGGLFSGLIGDVKEIAYGSTVKLCRRKIDGTRKAISQLREERKRRKEDKNDPTYVPEDTGKKNVPETGKKNRNKKSDTASNKKSAGDCVFDVSFVFLFFSISSLMNSSNI